MERITVNHQERQRNGRFSQLLPPLALLLLAGLAVWMILSQVGPIQLGARLTSASDVPQEEFIGATGVRIKRVSITASGGMIDLRYQIADPEKSVIVHDEEKPPAIIDEKSDAVISQPWHEHSHDQDLHTAVTYYELLLNPEGMIEPGDKVTIQIGDHQLKHVPVE